MCDHGAADSWYTIGAMAFVLSCPHFPACSGCSEIGCPHEVQIERKLDRVRRLFEKASLPGFDHNSIEKITANLNAEGVYRNRAKLVPARRTEDEWGCIGAAMADGEACQALPATFLADVYSHPTPDEIHGGVPCAPYIGHEAEFLTPYLRSHELLQREHVAAVAPAPGRIKLGLYRAGSHDVVDIPGCPVQTERVNCTIEAIRKGLDTFRINLYDEIAHTGDLRFISVREGVHTGEILVGFVTRTRSFPGGDRLTRFVMDHCRDVVGVIQNINPDKGNVIFGPKSLVLAGRDHLVEIVCGVRLQLGLTSFFQVNTGVAEQAYQAIAHHLDLGPEMTLLDLYSGVGAVGLVASRRVGQVIGIEEVGESIELARASADTNGFTNVAYERGLVEERLPLLMTDLKQGGASLDRLAVVVNPPRKGLDASVVRTLVQTGPNRIAYLSCSPQTLIRDLGRFLGGGYAVNHVELFDMFPQTEQVETLAVLQRAPRA